MNVFVPFARLGHVAALAALLAVLLAAPRPLQAAPPAVRLTPVATGIEVPVDVQFPPGDDTRMVVVGLTGHIRIVVNGTLLGPDFLNLNALLPSGSETGLFSLAFHPDYATNRAFYVLYTRSPDRAITVARYLRSASDPNVADPASGAVILTIPHPDEPNYGGRLLFGPDGFLYLSTGDGGGVGDPARNSQNNGVLLGKMLRIAVDGTTAPYTIPASNPNAGFTCAQSRCPEIFHYGLRNPWRYSFDRTTGDLYIGDVGSNAWEEVNRVPSGASNYNFGWAVFEGNSCFNDNYFSTSGGACAGLASHRPPAFAYGHEPMYGSSVTGGYVYRGSAIAGLGGHYVFGDFTSGRIFAASNSGGTWTLDPIAGVNPYEVVGFGQNNAGELFVAHYSSGLVSRIDRAAGPVATDFDRDGRADLLLRNTQSGATYAWKYNGTQFLGDQFIASIDPSWKLAGVGDFNGDSHNDLVWRHAASGTAYVWYLVNGVLQSDAQAFTIDPVWLVESVADFNADGKPDFLFRHASTGVGFVWYFDGITPASSQYLYSISNNWIVENVGDFDNDGYPDFFFRNVDPASGLGFVWFWNGTALGDSTFLFSIDPAWQVVQIADWNGDGKVDLVFRHANSGVAFVWYVTATNGLGASDSLFQVEPTWAVVPYR